MKKLLTTFSIALVIGLSTSSHASITIKVGTSGWGNATTASTNGMTWGFVIDSSSTSFSGTAAADLSAALVGFTIPSVITPSVPAQIGSSNYYFIEAQSQTSASGPPTFTNGFMNTAQFNLAGTVGTGDAAGLLWFATNTTTSGSRFGFQDLSQSLPLDGANITTGWGGTPANATLVVGIPEPSRVFLLGFACLGLIFRRRR